MLAAISLAAAAVPLFVAVVALGARLARAAAARIDGPGAPLATVAQLRRPAPRPLPARPHLRLVRDEDERFSA